MTYRRTAAVAAILLAALCASAVAFVPQKSRRSSSRSSKAAKKKTAPKPAKGGYSAAPAPDKVEEFLNVARQEPVANVAALVPFFEQLYRLQQGELPDGLHILHYGDSHAAADEWTGFLRSLFQHRFGDGGSGYSYAGRPWNSYRRLDLRSFASKGWYSDGLVGRPGDGMYGLGGVSVTTSRPNETVSLVVNCSTIEVLYLQQPGGGAIEFSEDGNPVVRISTDGPLGPGSYRHATTAGEHRFELRTVESAPVRLHGWIAENGPGLTYETLGINGAQASIVFHWDEQLLADHVARRNPALIVLAYGTNEAGNRDWTKESYREMFATLIYRFRKMAPAASILVVGPPDRLIRQRRAWHVYNNVDRIVEAQREAALGTGCAFWDTRAKMGGKGSMRDWVSAGLAQSDRVHFTAAGYRVLGGAVFQDLMENYSLFVDVRRQLIGDIAHGPQGEDH